MRSGGRDGKIDLFDARDVIPSVANHLVVNHWRVNKRSAIWNYNHSDYYVGKVLEYAAAIRGKLK